MKPFEFGLKEYGVQEVVGKINNPRVLEYFAKIGHMEVKDDETAWCAAFIGYCLETAGIPSSKALNARSYEKWGSPTMTPKLGDIAVFWRMSPTSGFGHVAFYISNDANGIWILGGNQGDGVCIERMPYKQLLSYRIV